MRIFLWVPLRSAVIDKSVMKTTFLSFSCLFTDDVTQSAACTAGCRLEMESTPCYRGSLRLAARSPSLAGCIAMD